MGLTQDSQGRRWEVYLHWARRPGWLRRKKREGGGSRWWESGDFTPLDLFDDPSGIVLVIGALILLVVLVWVGLPLLAFLLEIFWLLAAIVLGFVARLLFRRPWILVAESDQGQEMTWRIVGWRRARRAREQAERALREGRLPPKELPYVAGRR